MEKEGWEGGVLCCSPSHFTHQYLGVCRACLPPASSPSQVAPSQALRNIHVSAFLPPALPVSFLVVPGQSSAASFSSPPLPSHLPKDSSHPAALSVPHGPLEKPGPLYSLPPDTWSRVLNSQCLELAVILQPCWLFPDPCLCMVHSQVV